jgi:DNA mismatch endonuclease (patch repair protein)
MQANRKVDSAPELSLRRALWAAGVRGYRKNYPKLLGRPDIVFTRQKLLVDIRGCFWHNCPACRTGKRVEKNSEYWLAKVARNAERDAENEAAWSHLGYRFVVIWEHELRSDIEEVVSRLLEALSK